MKKKDILMLFCCLAISFVSVASFAGDHIVKSSEKTMIASGGKALLPIIISGKASAEVRDSAKYLADYLSKISGGKFEIKTGDGKTGVAVGTIKDFPELAFKPGFKLEDPGERQGYEIKSHANGVYIIGASTDAVCYAVFDLLKRLGYRMYFPMKKWEIIPSRKNLELNVHIRETPDYYTRRIWPGFGIWKEFQETTRQWNMVNRGGGYKLRSGHAYDGIISHNKKAFEEHPEYYGLLEGKRKSSKFCISNPGLRQLVSDYALKIFEQKPETDSISMDPSDGGGWCECAECAKIGSPSDRALFLANTVSSAVEKKFPGKRIGMYAYNQHSPPPSIDADPNVIVSIATCFNKLPVYEMIKGWSAKKATLGIREYYDCYLWTFDIFGKITGGNTDILKKTIPDFYRQNARYMSAEASDNWGSNGLGYYLAQQMLWNVKNSQKIDELTSDFLQNCFGPAAVTMKKFYEILDGANKKKLCHDTLGRMYSCLARAHKEAAGDQKILARLEDLAVYTRYCEVFMPYYQVPTNKLRLKVINEMLQFVGCIKNTRMVTSYAIYRYSSRLRRIAGGAKNSKPVNWESSKPFSSEDISKIISDGIANNKLLDFEVVNFSEDLVPAASFKKISAINKIPGYGRRGIASYYTWVDRNLKPIEVSVRAGGIKNTRNKSLYSSVKLYKIGGMSETGSRETLLKTKDIPIDFKFHVVSFTPTQPGLHKIVIDDKRSVSMHRAVDGTMLTLKQPADIRITKLYFYVPKGTKVLGFFCTMAHRGHIIAPNGKRLYSFKKTVGHHSITVPEGMDDKLWELVHFAGNINFLTVPPYVASTPDKLLLPKEVVDKDNL